MSAFWLGGGLAVAFALIRYIILDARRREKDLTHRPPPPERDRTEAPRRKKKKKKKPAPVEDGATASAPPAAPAIPSGWGWAKVHLAAAGLKSLGYYYRDPSAGYSFKELVDLNGNPSDDEIREAARAKNYIANSTFRLNAHDTMFPVAREGETREASEATYERGAGANDPGCAIVMLLTDEEKRLYDLPDAMPGIEYYATA